MFAIPKIPAGEEGEGEDQEEGGKSASNGSFLPLISRFTILSLTFLCRSCSTEHVDKLAEILLTYGHFDDNELGYVQGMSDLMAPLYVVMNGEEVSTFWCFVEFMERMVSLLQLL